MGASLKWHFLLLLVSFSFFPIQFSANGSETKVAVISAGGTPPEALDLLTIELSKLANVQVLERADLDRISKERSLSLMRAGDALAAGKIAGADAIVFLEASRETNVTIKWRLSLVREGIILDAKRVPWIPSEAARWAKPVATDLEPLLAKAVVPPGRAAKISVLNLRSPAATASSEAQDRELTGLLLLRLAREPDLLVLERRKMADLMFEKDLAGPTEKFWTGSYLLDGTVNGKGESGDAVTVSIRLRAPNGETEEINTAGTRRDLAGLIEKTVVGILEKLRIASNVNWDRDREAAQHAQEAEWALRWKMYEEAQAAADSTWALGLQNPGTAAQRILAYSQQAARPENDWVVSYLPDREIEMGRMPNASVAEVELVRMAVAVAEQTVLNHPEWMTNAVWSNAVCESLATAGDVLERFYWDKKAVAPASLDEVRQTSRSILQRCVEIPEVKKMYWFDEADPPLISELDRYYKGPNIFSVMAAFGAIFDENSEQTLATYRRLVSGDAFPYVREHLLLRDGRHPMYGGKRPARVRMGALPASFITELMNSTNSVIANEGEVLSWQYCKSSKELQPRLTAFEKRFLPNQPMGGYKAPPHFQDAIWRLSVFGPFQGEDSGLQELVLGRDRLDFADANVIQAIKAKQAKRYEAKLREMFTQLKPYDEALVASTIPGVQSAEYARELLPLAEEYLAKGTNQPGVFVEHQATLMNDQVRFLRAVANRPSPEEALRQMRARQEQMRALMARARTNQASSNRVAATPPRNTNVFVVPMGSKEYVEFKGHEWEPGSVRIWPPLHRHGALWFSVSEYGSATNENPAALKFQETEWIVSVNPRSGASEVFQAGSQIVTDFDFNGMFFDYDRHPRRHVFDVTTNYLFVSRGAKLLRFDLKTKQRKQFNAPATAGDVYTVNNRVFLSGDDAIYEITNGGAASVVLASARRKPALTVLDQLPSLGRAPVIGRPGEGIRALHQSNIYDFDGKEWTQLTHFSEDTKARLRGETVIFNVPQNFWAGEEMHVLNPDAAEPLFLGANMPQRSEDREKAAERLKQARFAMPDFYVGGAHIIVNGNVTFFGTRVGMAGDGIKAAFAMTIYDPSCAEPLAVPIDFDGMRPRHNGNFLLDDSHVWIAETANGICMGLPDEPGFWRIPRETLDKGIASARSRVAQKPQATNR